MRDAMQEIRSGVRSRIADIAREAGVGTATVDRVLNDRKGVGRPTAERVLEVARRLNYPLPPQLVAMPGLVSLNFDFLLPAGPHPFFKLVGDALETVEERFPRFRAMATRHDIEKFNPAALADSLLRIGKQSNGVAFIALEHPQVREAVNTLVERGVPVVTMVSDLSNSRRLGYVGIDNRAAGRTAGHLLGRFIGRRAGKVAMIAGSLSYRGHEEREMGFRHILREEFPRLEIVGLREGHDDDAQNYSAAREILQQHPDLLGIYNIGAGASGIGEAIEEAGRGGEITFVSHELMQATRRFLISGTLDAVINQNARHEVINCVRMLANYHAKRELTTNVEPTRIEIFLRENLP
jgi:LacI family transcriptional regulator